MTKSRGAFFILAVTFLSFLALGMPNGGLGVAWPSIRYEMRLPLEWAGAMLIVSSGVNALTSSQLGRISKVLALGHIAFIGVILLIFGLIGIAIAPAFPLIILSIALIGIGSGLTGPSIGSYAALTFSARINNWLHCFWGLGATISPIIMTAMILRSGWRMGYAVLTLIAGMIAVAILISITKGIWKHTPSLAQADKTNDRLQNSYLTGRRYFFMAILFFFIFASSEHAIGFWITSVLLESRGFSYELAGLYPAVNFGFLMGSRFLFGFLSARMSDRVIIRTGFVSAAMGVFVLLFTGHIAGMALVGFGFAPIFPCVMHANASRFSPDIFTKLVGYQLAAVGAGIAILSSGIGQVLSRVSLEALFPIALVLIALACTMNEVLERAHQASMI